MCKGMKKCKTCASKSIGKMGKRKVTRRRRRMGKISSTDAKGALYNGLLAVGGAIAANVVGDAINKDGKKWMTSLPQLVLGVGLSLTKNPMARAAGTGMIVKGGINLLKDFGITASAIKGVGNPFTRIAAPYQSSGEVMYTQG